LGVILIVLGFVVILGNLAHVFQIPTLMAILSLAGGIILLVCSWNCGLATAGIEEWPHSD
jgi:threonine/homoserine/homoserine lactone efflux protein